jgi:poly(3-hydroxybutyrate) depolymerase
MSVRTERKGAAESGEGLTVPGESSRSPSAIAGRILRMQDTSTPERILYGTLLLAFTLGPKHSNGSVVPRSDDSANPRTMSAGCTRKDVPLGVSMQTTTDGNGTPRTYLLQVPARYNPERGYPLIFVFHGRGGTSAQSHSWGLQNAQGAAENGVFVFPQGIDYRHEAVGWDDSSRGYDMAFFDRMLQAIEAGQCIDPTRVFVAGFSWGGDFATALACNRGDIIRAIAVNSSNDEFKNKSDATTYRYLPCPSLREPAIRFEHAIDGDSAYPAPYFATTSKLFQSFDRCGSASKPVAASTSTSSCIAFDGCAEKLMECSFDKTLGHRLPPGWAQDTWDFFQSFGKP